MNNERGESEENITAEGYYRSPKTVDRPDAKMDVRRTGKPVVRSGRKKWLNTGSVTATIVAVVVLFAFIWEQVNDAAYRSQGADPPPKARSGIQDELDKTGLVTRNYLPINEFSRPGTRLDKVNGIVIHYIGNPGTTAIQNRNYFANLAVTEETNASSNFIIGLDGEIIQCVPVDEVAYASNTRNDDTLSIELCHPDDTGEFTVETYAAAVRLTAWLCEKFGLLQDDIIRHYDITGKLCPKFFVDNEDAWELFKADVFEELK